MEQNQKQTLHMQLAVYRNSSSKDLLKLYPQDIVSSSGLDKFSIRSLAHQWIVCSEWVPSERESKQLITFVIRQKAACLYTCIIKRCLMSNHCFRLSFCREEIIWSESGEKSVQIKHHLQTKTVQNSFKQPMLWLTPCFYCSLLYFTELSSKCLTVVNYKRV